MKKCNIIKADIVYDNKWLDVEELFSKYGWSVDYDKPGFNEEHDPIFTFTKRENFERRTRHRTILHPVTQDQNPIGQTMEVWSLS